MWPFRKKEKKQGPVQVKATNSHIALAHSAFKDSATHLAIGGNIRNPIPTAPQRDSGGDFITGFLVGEALSGGNPTAGLVGGAIGGVEGGIIGAELAPEPTSAPEFGGGESGGAGASGGFDSPSCDTSSSDSSSSDSSSSCDSGSSDSGSSGGSDF